MQPKFYSLYVLNILKLITFILLKGIFIRNNIMLLQINDNLDYIPSFCTNAFRKVSLLQTEIF